MKCPWVTTVLVAAALAAVLPGCSLLRRDRSAPGDLSPIRSRQATSDQLARLDEAAAAREAGDLDHALGLFQEILAENPTITPAYLGLGDIYMIRKDYKQAEPAYRRAARIEPRNFDAVYGHGLALQMLERLAEAVKAYQRALSIRPDDPRANLNLATTFLQMAQARQALVYAEHAVTNDPASGAARANLGAVYERLDRNAEAIHQYEAAVELMGNDPRLIMNLVNVLTKERRFVEAANTAETLVKIDPTAPGYERLGRCYFRLRRYDDSIGAYRKAVEIDSTHWPALNGVGVNALNTWLLSKKQDAAAKAEARDAFRRSLQINVHQDKVIALISNYNL